LGLLEPEDKRYHNLPAQPTPFIGRKAELGELVEMVTDPGSRLVTILGPGGIGKTRLAIETARAHAETFADGVFFVPLASLDDPLAILPQIANALGLSFYVRDQREHWEYDPEKEQLLAYLREKHLLLILDNAEHLLTPSAPSPEDWKQGIEKIAADILVKAPEVSLLITSREQMNLQGERVYFISGLSVPKSKQLHTANEKTTDWFRAATSSDALQLFEYSAGRVQPGFDLTPDNIEQIVDICNLVEGMPLGIELAATWSVLLPPAEIATEIRRNLDFLKSSAKNIPERQRSIRSIFESTWERLSDIEHSVFRQLSVFRGGFTREAAQAVTEVTLPVLKGLVNKSLVQYDFKRRYHIHELFRQFGAERLAQDPNLETEVRDRSCAFFAAFLRGKEPDLRGMKHRQVLEEIEVELDNVRTAWNWAVKNIKLEELDMAMESLCEFFRFRGSIDEGFDAFYPAALALGWEGFRSPGELPQRQEMFQDTLQLLRENAYSGVRNGRKLQVQGRMMARYARFYCESPGRAWKACQFRQDTLEVLSRAGMQQEMAWVLRYLGHVWFSPKEVLTLYQRALAIFREVVDENGIVDVLYRLGTVATESGEYQQAEDDLTESLSLARSIGRQDIALNCLLELGNLSWVLGDLPNAVVRIEEARSVNEEVGYVTQEARAGRILARVTLSQGDDDRAERMLQDSLKIYQDLGLKGLQAETIGELAHVVALTESFSTAKQLALESIDRCEKLEYLAGLSLPFTILGHAALIQGDLQEAEQCFHQAVKTALDAWYPAHALNALEGMVRLLNACGNPEESFRLATYIYNHPASWWWTKERLVAQLSAVETSLSPALLSDDQGTLEGQTLKDVVGEVFAKSG